MSKRRKEYTKEFKEETVKYSFESDKTLAEIAEDLGISLTKLTRWRSPNQQGNTFTGKGNLRPETEKLRKLKKEKAD